MKVNEKKRHCLRFFANLMFDLIKYSWILQYSIIFQLGHHVISIDTCEKKISVTQIVTGKGEGTIISFSNNVDILL